MRQYAIPNHVTANTDYAEADKAFAESESAGGTSEWTTRSRVATAQRRLAAEATIECDPTKSLRDRARIRRAPLLEAGR